MREVAKSLSVKTQKQEPKGVQRPGKNLLDRGVADAFDVIRARLAEQQVNQNPQQKHAAHVPQVGIANPRVEEIFERVDRANVKHRNETDEQPQPDIGDEQERMREMEIIHP